MTNPKKYNPRVADLPTSAVINKLIGLVNELDEMVRSWLPEHRGLWQEDHMLIAEAKKRAGRLEKDGD